jgi:hypothetical protein
MSDKSNKATKAELLKMLADAVLNTPGAKLIEPVIDAAHSPAMRKSRSAPKRIGKTRGARSGSVSKKSHT